MEKEEQALEKASARRKETKKKRDSQSAIVDSDGDSGAPAAKKRGRAHLQQAFLALVVRRGVCALAWAKAQAS